MCACKLLCLLAASFIAKLFDNRAVNTVYVLQLLNIFKNKCPVRSRNSIMENRLWRSVN